MSSRAGRVFERKIRTFVKDLNYLPFDLMDSFTRRRDKFAQPRRLVFVGDGDFRKIGEGFFRYFVDLGGLNPNHKVLDVGCGIGRMAVPLTKYLTTGSYYGFDIVKRGISWTNRVIGAQYPNFHFELADVFNSWYNPAGKYSANEYKFPYPDNTFDFIYATSVFTHMLQPEMENYLSEIMRILKPGGRSLITYLLVNSESQKLNADGLSTLKFEKRNSGDIFRTISKETPEAAVGYDQEYIMRLYESLKLSILSPVRYGSWCGRKEYLSYQDIIISEKAS